MAKEKPPEPPAEDIPAWFMTYSDVITLLMTFFILLLTFSTTEPEKFDKVVSSAFGSSGATGVVGHVHERMDNKSSVQRVRPRAARIAMTGSEMPPMDGEPPSKAVGKGLQSVDDDQAKIDVMKTNSFQLSFGSLINENGNITPRGANLAALLTEQLRNLPVHCSIKFSDEKLANRAAGFLQHLYEVNGVRPGQVGIGLQDGIQTDQLQFDIERYEN
jgi:flagellar motor protein MotB